MRARSLHPAVLGAAIAVIAIAAPAARAGAAPRAACTTTSGVTVIVDFTYFHGSIERGCAAGTPNTALAAIRGAGFETAGTTQYGDGFVCRIDNEPTPKVEACNHTPPASSSWSFYYARPDDSTWTFSTAGVLSYRPPPGTIVAFAFGNYARPSVPPAAVAPEPAPPTTTAPPPSTPPSTGAPVVAQANATTATAAGGTATTTAPPTTVPRAVPLHTGTSTSATTSTTSSARVVDRKAAIGDEQVSPSSGSPVGAVLAVVLVLGLGTGARLAIRARRRRAT